VKIAYDKIADALDITLVEDGFSVRTEQLDDGTLVDLDEQGRLVAIEVIRPARRWPLAEILERYEVAGDDAEVLESLWAEPKTYPFADPSDLGAQGTASGDLVKA
jgi:uncharacterized protein YuzE